MEELRRFLEGCKKLLIVGMGNVDRGDDSFGILVSRKIRDAGVPSFVKVIEAGASIEAYLEKIIEEKPTHVIFLDASKFGGSPGDVLVGDPEKTSGEALSTHNVPLKLLVKYLKSRGLNARCLLIGCEPKSLDLFSPPSKEIKASSEVIAREILEAIRALSTS